MIPTSFFKRDPLICARELIGTELVWGECAGVIVETEAYLAENDEACHAFFRPSIRAFIERNDAGAAYIYLNYGVHWMLNALVKGDDERLRPDPRARADSRHRADAAAARRERCAAALLRSRAS